MSTGLFFVESFIYIQLDRMRGINTCIVITYIETKLYRLLVQRTLGYKSRMSYTTWPNDKCLVFDNNLNQKKKKFFL